MVFFKKFVSLDFCKKFVFLDFFRKKKQKKETFHLADAERGIRVHPVLKHNTRQVSLCRGLTYDILPKPYLNHI
jgi:hypothetical protein